MVDAFSWKLGITGIGEIFLEIQCIGTSDYLVFGSCVRRSVGCVGREIVGNQVISRSRAHDLISHDMGSLCLNMDGSIC